MNNLNAFSFLPPDQVDQWTEKFEEKGLWLEIPIINYSYALEILENVPEKKAFDTPVLGVFGTSSQQGKFTLQLALRYELQKRGYKVGQIGTEHQSGCFGIDFTFPSGYGLDKSLQIPMDFHIPLLRRVISEMDKSNYDLIIVGAQSGLLNPDPYYYGNLYSEIFCSAVIPDRVILIYSKHDENILINIIEEYIHAKTHQYVFAKISFEKLQNNLVFHVNKLVSRLEKG